MNKETRNAIERATQRARKLLEEDFAAQLEGDFDVHKGGVLAAKAGGHLSARQAFQRERIVAAIEHKRAAGVSAADSVGGYLRDAAFTTLNRFVALKMLEACELVQECITKGEQSAGYREFSGMASGLPLLPDSAGYRLYIESLFDELSTEVKVLFDRRDPSSVLWPKRATFEQLLDILNAGELAGVWGEDETIGWVYQFFNGEEDRKAARYDENGKAKAPQNSRELAVRNQFFTPRYVVQFLTDNTLGRIWYEMRGTKTVLAERCEYMVRKPGEEFPPRAKKDPRDLRVLDPACGSGHFLLYAFDLLLAVYEEAHADPESPKSEATDKTLAADYPTLDALRKALPGLILAHNLHGVDIDPRCAQIAQLALWMRAQKAYRDFVIGRAERSQIRRSNIVVAEPLVANDQTVKEFVAKLGDVELGSVFTSLVDSLNLAGDLGLLLRVEQLVARKTKHGESGCLFVPPEEHIRASLARFVSDEGGHPSTRRRLLADDTNQGLALLEIAEQKFDTIVMNPPFGELSPEAKRRLTSTGVPKPLDAYAQFLYRASELLAEHGRVGALVSKTFLSHAEFEVTRRWLLSNVGAMRLMAELGTGVLDAAVEVAAVVLAPGVPGEMTFVDLTETLDKSERLRQLVATPDQQQVFHRRSEHFLGRAGAPLSYRLDSKVSAELAQANTVRDIAEGLWGLFTADDERFVRAWWEVAPASMETVWYPYAKGGAPQGFFAEPMLVVNWSGNGAEILSRRGDKGQVLARAPNKECFGQRGFTYSSISSSGLRVRPLNEGTIFSIKGPALFPRVGPDDWLPMLELLNSAEVSYLLSTLSVNRSAELNYALRISVPGGWRSHFSGDTARRLSSLGQWVASGSETSRYFSGYPIDRNIDNVVSPSTLDQLVTGLRDAGSAAYAQIGLSDTDTASFVFSRAHLPPSPPCDEHAIASYLVGCAFGRWQQPDGDSVSPIAWDIDPFERLPSAPPAAVSAMIAKTQAMQVFVTDPGHRHDLLSTAWEIVDQRPALTKMIGKDVLAFHLESSFFAEHIRRYSTSGRKAPIYWQLATQSASYSVWLYIHAFSKDTLFRVQDDYVTPKLAHEERRLESLTSELRDKATASHRKELAAQESVVEELRAFLEEVKRVAPLWNPNLDDGVIINFAPLWRLVPQNKSWQRELKSAWDALCEGKYDWAHLAMHLWPERVVPKCSKDRSYAIAHGLDNVFWIKGADSKWTARKTLTRSIEDLVRERTSPAVRAALKSLLEAPAAPGNGGRGRGGRSKTAAAAKGGDA